MHLGPPRAASSAITGLEKKRQLRLSICLLVLLWIYYYHYYYFQYHRRLHLAAEALAETVLP